MNQLDNSSTCERADDLISVLYGEVSEREKRDFEIHLKQCHSCRAEFVAFAQIRESIGEYRDEALRGFVSAQATPATMRKSAIAALRQFFDLSPLWLKGAVGFAAVALCALAVLAAMRLQTNDAPAVAVNPAPLYTQQDVDRMVKEALAKQELALRRPESKPMVVVSSPSKNSTVANSMRVPKARRPFSKAEREQLAAELRLLSTQDDIDLDLLGDRINK